MGDSIRLEHGNAHTNLSVGIRGSNLLAGQAINEHLDHGHIPENTSLDDDDDD